MDVLFIEDNAGGVRLAEGAFGSSPEPVTLHFVSDGIEAMAFLREEGAYWSAPKPNLILLDLSVRTKDSRQVLAEIKNDSALNAIPMIVLIATDNPEDIQYCCENRVNCYVLQPGDPAAFHKLTEIINIFLSTPANSPAWPGNAAH